jgi:predicted nucleotidyltransferase
MNIHRLLSTRERVRTLNFVLYKTSPLCVNEVAKDLRLSKGLISKFFGILSRENILKKTDNKFIVQDNVSTRAIKILLNLSDFDANTFKKFKFVKGAGLYGSFVKGKNTEESDIDLWVLVTEDIQEEILAKLTNELKKKNGNIKPLYLIREKIKTLKKEDAVFYHSLVFGSINVYGEEIETI